MPSCVVKWCKNNSCDQKKPCGITFHKFPTESMWKERWIRAIRDSRNEEDWLPSKYSVVCSIHFEDCDIYDTKCGLRRIKKNAKPKKLMNQRGSEPSHGPEQSTSDIKIEPLSEQPDSEKELNASNFYDHTSAEHAEDVSRREHDSTPDPEEIHDSELDSIYDSPKRSSLRKQVRKYKMRLQISKKKIKTLHQKVRRLKKRNAFLNNVLKDLKERRNTDVFNMLEENIVAADSFD